MENNEKQLLLEQYKNYNYSKEQYISRTFGANRYYMVVCMVLLLTSYVLTTFTPASLSVLIASILGILVSVLWWLNVDTYNIFIKVKYAKVLEKLEKDLPATPFYDEFKALQEVKSQKFNFVFADVQKTFATLMFLAFFMSFCYQAIMLFRSYARPVF